MTNNIVDSQVKSSKSIIIGYLKQYFAQFGYFFGLLLLIFGSLVVCSKLQTSINQYLVLQATFFIVGILHCISFLKLVSWSSNFINLNEILWTLLIFAFSFTFINFSEKLPLIAQLPSSYIFSSLYFLIPYLFMMAWSYYIALPTKVYKNWVYPYGKEVPVIEVLNPKKIKFYLTKTEGDNKFAEFELNVPTKYKIADFLHYFIHRYNYDKNPQSPIFISPDNTNNDLYEWEVYTKHSVWGKKVLDFNKSFDQLGLKNGQMLIVNRISNLEK